MIGRMSPRGNNLFFEWDSEKFHVFLLPEQKNVLQKQRMK
jgi:hypothetical protein